MPSKKISIVLSDVDGTLLDSQKRITERAKAAIQKLRDAGIKFAVASARPPRGMKMIAEQIPLSAPIAALNGGMLVDPGPDLRRDYYLWKLPLSNMGTDLRIRRDNDKPMLRKALNNARQLLYDLKDDLWKPSLCLATAASLVTLDPAKAVIMIAGTSWSEPAYPAGSNLSIRPLKCLSMNPSCNPKRQLSPQTSDWRSTGRALCGIFAAIAKGSTKEPEKLRDGVAFR
jgi:hypothetical protein